MKYFICLFFILISCNSRKDNPVIAEKPNSSLPKDVLVPLSVGNSWITKFERLDSNGIVIELNIDTLKIVKDTIINDLIWYQSNHGSFNRNDTDGYYLYDSYLGISRLFKFPAETGDSILLKGSTFQYCKLISKNDTLEVYGTKYLTYKYKIYQTPSPNTYLHVDMYFYYKPNIGLIKYELIGYYVQSGKIFGLDRITLISFTVK